MHDAELLDRLLKDIADGGKSALAALYEAVSPAVYSFALSVLGSRADAEDVLQDVFVEIFRSAKGYKSVGKPMGWIISITKSKCLMKLRHDRFTARDADVEALSPPVDFPEDKIIMKLCIEKLPEEERRIVLLKASGLKHREIAEILGMNLSTVLSKYHRALKKLKCALLGKE